MWDRPRRRPTAAKSTRPTLDRVAKMGISFNRFHSTAMCSPTRAALLTGRNHTASAMARSPRSPMTSTASAARFPKSSATVAEVLKNYGYNTGAWGKWHNTPEEQITSKGPFDYWPTGYGFEYFYGFLAGEASQYEPTCPQHHPVTEHLPKGYHLTDDIASDAIKWLREQKAYAPDKPFFMYWAPGASHGPHQVMKEWADKYKGKFDDGWDKYRERVFARQKQGMDSAERPAHAAPRVDGFVGFDSRGRKAVPASAHGSLRRLHRARGLQRRPGDRRNREAGQTRQHAHLLHLGRQRFFRRRALWHHQRATRAERHPDQDLTAPRGAGGTRWPWMRSAARRRTTCITPPGPGRAAHPTSPPSSSVPTSAAPASRWPSPGRRASKPIHPARRSFITSSTSCRRSTSSRRSRRPKS
jgi:hypothetical protein